MGLKENIEKLYNCLENAQKHEIDLSRPILASLDFNICRQNLHIQDWKTILNRIRKEIQQLSSEELDPQSQAAMINLVEKLDAGKDVDKVMIDQLSNSSKKIKLIQQEQKIQLPTSIPSEIFPELESDINELSKCFTSGCFRSCVILCGRILEVVLHRKYYDTTGNDLLEKSPGIGLGNLIAKMKDKNMEFDPGITQQIHLVNQVRIFSVHKKQQPFYPTKQQAYAMILYTMDILEKLFA
ncbi:hypothetical protein KY321_04210 [Candidatus Woesearchaeota archaeon]|nr:hypothetical protein [Candidatus Woesearchaeota archaeon]